MNDKEQKVETSTEAAIVGNTVLPAKETVSVGNILSQHIVRI